MTQPQPIYRFKFNPDFTQSLSVFSKIHQYDDRKTFKEEWEKWIDDNEEYIMEIRRLSSLGYEGDIEDKIFNSARYYYRKKSLVRPEVKDRRQYITINKSFIQLIDKHITDHISENYIKPSDCFDNFCQEYKTEIMNETMDIITKNQGTSDDIIENKLKKTYKNRYFLVVRAAASDAAVVTMTITEK